MAEYTDKKKVTLATQAHIDAGVLTLFHAFMYIYAMQNQTSKLIDEIAKLREHVDGEVGVLQSRIDSWSDSGHS